MASIEDRIANDGTKSWRVVWRLDGHKQSVTVRTTRKAAVTLAAAITGSGDKMTRQQVLDADRPTVPTSTLTVAQWCVRYVAALTSVEEVTRSTYTRMVEMYVEPHTIGATALTAVTTEQVSGWMNDLKRSGLSAKTIKNHHGTLSAAFNVAVRDGRMPRNPAYEIEQFRADDHIEAEPNMYLTPQQVEAFANLLTGIYSYVAVALAYTGMRWSELTALRVGDVDFNGRIPTATVSRAWRRQPNAQPHKLGPPKTQRSRRLVVLGDRAVEAFRALAGDRAPGEWLVCSNVDPHRALPLESFRKAWKLATVALLADGTITRKPRVHDLRHTYASWFISENLSPAFVSEQLGHADIGFTMRVYASIMPKSYDGVVEAANRLSASARPARHLRSA